MVIRVYKHKNVASWCGLYLIYKNKKLNRCKALLMQSLGEICDNNPADFYLMGYNAVKSIGS
jgi:hypothetical protein